MSRPAIALTILEVTHLVFLGCWNSEIFAAITGLVGTVTGIMIGAKNEVVYRKGG